MTLNKKRVLTLLALVSSVCMMAFSSNIIAIITGVTPRNAGVFYYSQANFDSATIGGVGGVVKIYQVASGDTEKIGNIVFLTSKNTINHSATLVNYNSIEGIVVGGTATSMQASYVVGDTSTTAALPGGQVLVLERGRAWVLADTGAGIAPGLQVIPSAKSGMGGRLTVRTTAIDTLNRIFGKTVDTTLSGKAVLVDVRVR